MKSEQIEVGDIVLVVDSADPEMINAITQVLRVYSNRSIQIRGAGTTITTSTQSVRKIPVKKDVPIAIRVPMKPKGVCLNHSGFRNIPWDWFPYEIPRKHK